MHVSVVLAVAHGTNLVMDGIGVVVVCQMMLYECIDYFPLGCGGEFVWQCELNFSIAGAIGPLVFICGGEELLGGAGPGGQVMTSVDTATLSGKRIPAVYVICMM